MLTGCLLPGGRRQSRAGPCVILRNQHPPGAMYVDNTMTVGIANNPIKKQQSRTMNMRYFWVMDQANLNNFRMIWAPGLDNLADYFIKHHLASHHKTFHPYYFSCPIPRTLARAPSPSSLQECVKFSNISYQHGMSPLAQPPQYTWHT
jgi:hypothetical protein